MRTAATIFLLFCTAAIPAGAQIDVEQGRAHWAYQPLRKVATPAVDDLSWPRDLVDHHLLAAMEQRGLKPVADADRRTLIRRATYDLTGLPPTPAEVDAFLGDAAPTPQALAKVVDRLLASPAYGERWGRHWLDLVRYADTSGNSSDHPVPEAHRYRDYVIAAFNKDKPFDQFVREQIAGDLLPHSSEEQRREQIIATGYIAGARRFGVSGKETVLTVEDTITNLGEAFLATSIGCARCHDHTHDPVPMTDYYALAGIFESTRYPFPGSENEKTPSDFVSLSGDPAERAKAELTIARLDRSLDELKRKRRNGNAPQDYDMQHKQLEGEMRAAVATLANFSDLAYAVADLPEAKDAHVRELSGSKGELVRRGFLQVLGGHKLPEGTEGSGRLQLAEWITSADNPLFARVAVNRIWGWHFGRALVTTPNDFGAYGAKPSHPDLLDHLARQFIADGYSFKKMHRRLMLTRAYSLSSKSSEANATPDPDAAYRWRFERRRLSAEEVRDSMLATSGQLERGSGGAHPFPPKEKWRYSQHGPFYAAYHHDRRSVYLMQQRLRKHPILGAFDAADTNLSTPEREGLASPVQSLFLMNAKFAHRSAASLAARLAGDATGDKERIRLAHRLLFGREAAEEDIELGQRFLVKCHASLCAENPGLNPLEAEALALEAYARVLFCSNEFIYID